jgi:hypothetical protein
MVILHRASLKPELKRNSMKLSFFALPAIAGLTIMLSPLSAQISSGDGTVDIDPKWELTLDLSALMNFGVYSKNWAGEETNNLSWSSKATAGASRPISSKVHWRNMLKLEYGMIHSDPDADWENWESSKALDLIDLESLLKFTLDAWVDPYIAFRLVSQFFNEGEDEDTYINPIELTETIGAARDLVSRDRVSWDIRLGCGARQTIDRTLEAMTTSDLGLEVSTEFQATDAEGRTKFRSLLKAFETLYRVDAEDEDYRYPDIDWQNDLTVNLTRYFQVVLGLQLLYDREIDPDPRLKSTASIGVAMTLSNTPKVAK